MKSCEKCVKTYDDTWGVCLLCGSKLEREKACREVCDIEGKSPDDVSSKLDIAQAMVIFWAILAVSLILFAAFYFGMSVWQSEIQPSLTKINAR